MRSSSGSIKTGNLLLDMVPPEVLERLGHFELETVSLHSNQLIQDPGETVEHVFFPTRGLISMVAELEDGACVEVGMIGKEGMFPISTVLGDDTPSQRALVQLAGSAIRVNSTEVRQHFEADAAFRSLLLRYAQATLTTATQSAACNRLHQLEQRCAKWLLSARDRAEEDKFPMTHEFLAMMLGVRRPGVTIALQSLQSDGMITYNHGNMTIIDRAGLEAKSCECYRFLKNEFSRLLGGGQG
jgi:CRP-like cAMP-binding protein